MIIFIIVIKTMIIGIIIVGILVKKHGDIFQLFQIFEYSKNVVKFCIVPNNNKKLDSSK